jgi:hypothetical protein
MPSAFRTTRKQRGKRGKRALRSGKRFALTAVRRTVRKRRRSKPETAVRINGLSVRQHAFLREKILGMSDKDAALAAGYSPSVAENTKQKIWTPEVTAEFERLKVVYMEAWRAYLAQIDAAAPNSGDSRSEQRQCETGASA